MKLEVNELRKSIKTKYEQIAIVDGLNSQIIRGHIPAISFIVENEITLFLNKIMKKGYLFFIDCTIGEHRPDLIIVNEKTNQCELIIEIKSNMGYCRNIKTQIKKYLEQIEWLENNCKIIYYQYIDGDRKKYEKHIEKSRNIKMILISLTSHNCSNENHNINKKELENVEIKYFNLFDGWYNDLKENEINQLIEWLGKYSYLR